MIIWLYEILNQVVLRRIFGFTRITITHLIFLGMAYLTIRGQISMVGIVVIIVPVVMFSTGVLIPPYAYLINIFKLKVNTKIFKKSIYIYSSKHGNITLRKKKGEWETIFKPIGIIVQDRIYLEKPDTYFDKSPILWGMKGKIVYLNKFEEFEKELKEEDDLETIKRKIILNTLEH